MYKVLFLFSLYPIFASVHMCITGMQSFDDDNNKFYLDSASVIVAIDLLNIIELTPLDANCLVTIEPILMTRRSNSIL